MQGIPPVMARFGTVRPCRPEESSQRPHTGGETARSRAEVLEAPWRLWLQSLSRMMPPFSHETWTAAIRFAVGQRRTSMQRVWAVMGVVRIEFCGDLISMIPSPRRLTTHRSEFPQHLPRRHESLYCGGWWKNPFLEGAFSIRGLVDSLHAVITQHRQLPGEFCQLFTAQDRLRFGAACRNRILADSLFVRHQDG